LILSADDKIKKLEARIDELEAMLVQTLDIVRMMNAL